MAIISIPTSIGGLTIPGSVTSGPLGALFGNKFGRNDLSYPRDLGSATRGHYIQFNVLEVKPATYDVSTVLTDIGKKAAAGLGIASNQTGSFLEDPVAYIKNTAAGVVNFASNPESITKALTFTQSNTIPAGSISLYIPDTVNFTYNAQYENTSLATAAQQIPVVSAVLKPVVQTFRQNDAVKLLLRSQGVAFNPNLQLLFDGINFRDYQMAFTFTPYSKQEAQTVAKIIEMFKKHSAPRLGTAGGMFFIPPSIFEPKFYFNGRENRKINRIAKSVITSVDVNYAPNGFSTYDDGAPVQTQLTINFKEIELITRDKIEQGY
jgi:hypothetical protein